MLLVYYSPREDVNANISPGLSVDKNPSKSPFTKGDFLFPLYKFTRGDFGIEASGESKWGGELTLTLPASGIVWEYNAKLQD
jgi:hypothetical protein